MRTLSMLLLVACSTPSAPTSPDETPGATEADTDPSTSDTDARRGRSSADAIAAALADMPARPTPTSKLWQDDRYPPQGAPRPVDMRLASLPSWSGTRWSLRDGRTLSFADDQATLDGETEPAHMEPHGGTFGERRLRLVTPCAAALLEDGFWEPLARTAPACTPEEAAVEPAAHITWRLPSKDHYVLLPSGHAWRYGPKRVFMRPIGSWSLTEEGPTLSFGPTTFTGHTVDACHTAFESSANDSVHRAARDFPDCPDALKTYDGLAWTLWRGNGGDLLDLRAPGEARLDQYTRRALHEGGWTPTEDGLRVELGEALTADLTVSGCSATGTDAAGTAWTFTRTWPRCGSDAAAGTK